LNFPPITAFPIPAFGLPELENGLNKRLAMLFVLGGGLVPPVFIETFAVIFELFFF
jgi:hypothetical protein